MSANADLSSLAALAQTRGGDLRPVLLQAQTDLFINGRRDPEAIATYATLALGLVPLVDKATLRAVAQSVAPIPETPPALREAIAARLAEVLPAGRDEVAEAAPLTDLALARDLAIVLDGHRLGELVDRARGEPALAAALLARPEPTVFDRAALYRFATRPQRAAIRDDLARRLPSGSAARLSPPPEMREPLLVAPDGPRVAIMMAGLGIGPAPDAAIIGMVGQEVEQELFALALVALGLTPEECIRLFLTLDRSIAHSVAAIMHLAGVARSTHQAAATFLAGGESQAARTAPQHRPAEAGGLYRPTARLAQPPLEAKSRHGTQRRHG
jgi:hypothetical protein